MTAGAAGPARRLAAAGRPGAASPPDGRERTVLLAHGSPDPRHDRDVRHLADRLADLTGDAVAVAYLDHHGPTPAQCAADAAADGVRLCAMPLFVSPGYHLRVDVPQAVAAMAAVVPVTTAPAPVLLGGTAGPPAWLRAAVLELAGGAPPSVVLVTAGSRDAGILAAWDGLAVRARRAWGVPVAVAHGTGPGRRIGAALAGGSPPGGPHPGAIVVPVLVADGRILDDIRADAERSGLRTTVPIGATHALARHLSRALPWTLRQSASSTVER